MKDHGEARIASAPMPGLCQECEARHNGICSVLTGAELQHLNKYSQQKVVPKGTTLLRMGETPEYHANVLSGVVKPVKTLEDGRQQIVALQFAPDFLGRSLKEQSLVTAETATDVRLCRFPRTIIEQMIADIPKLQRRVFEHVLLQLDLARDWILTLGRKTASEKVASFLLLIAIYRDPLRDENDLTDASFELPLSRADIADFLGLTLETVSRQISKLRELDVIEVTQNRTVRILDRQQLVAMSGP